MERLTRRRDGRTYIVGCPDFALPKIVGLIIQQTVDRLAAYEDTGLEPEEIAKIREDIENGYMKSTARRYGISVDRLRQLAEADRAGRCFVTPFIAMVEQSLTGGEMKPQRDQRFNGRYAVVYFDKEKWAFPLIDICGKHYDRKEAEERMKLLRQKDAEATLKGEHDG